MHFKPTAEESGCGQDGHEGAEYVAINALQYLASDSKLLERFVGITGIAPDQFRDAASERGFLVGVLDFFIAHEPSLIALGEAIDIAPENIVKARNILEPLEQDHA